MKISINRSRVIFYSWVGLAFLVLLSINHFDSEMDTFLRRGINSIWGVFYLTAINFIFFDYLLPFIKFNRKGVLIGMIIIPAQLILYSFGLFTWRFIGINLHFYTPFKFYESFANGVIDQTALGIASFFIFGITNHVYHYKKLKDAAQQLLIEKQEAELNYLKSQTNPHFLFNTLNNIYSLTRDKSDLAPESILRLSKILRFMLYETSGSSISIDQELKIIADYIALEKLRYDDTLVVNFNHSIDNNAQTLPPLLLMPLVENAFKHGVSETRDLPFVEITLSVIEQQLLFKVKNSTETNTSNENLKENIGLANLRRQLELLYKDYHLAVEKNDNIFSVTLAINLDSHV